MKKIFAITVLILLVLLTVACTEEPPELPPEPTPTPTPAPTPTPTPTPEPTPEPEEDYPEDDYPEDDFDLDTFFDQQIGLDEILALRSEARWLFEQMFLPGVISQFHEYVIEYLHDNDEDSMTDFMVWVWDYMADLFIYYELGDDDDPLLDLARLMLETALSNEHIVEVTIENLDGDVIAAIVKLFDLEESHRSTYLAIVYSGENELRLFTLEQSAGFHMFCFVGVEQRGSFFPVENNREAFVEAIIEVIETGMDAGASLIWGEGITVR